MNINFKIDKEKENVIVSNEKGTMETREYQDNIKDVLILEDVVEGLEKELDKLNQHHKEVETNRANFEKRINEAPQKQKRADKKWYGFSIWAFVFPTFLGYATKVSDLKTNVFEQLHNTEVLASTQFSACVGFIFASSALLTRYRWKNANWKENQEELENAKTEESNLKIELFYTREILFKYRELLMYQSKDKQKSNLQNMSAEIQEVSYFATLEGLRSYIKQLCQQYNEQRTLEDDNEILRRIKELSS